MPSNSQFQPVEGPPGGGVDPKGLWEAPIRSAGKEEAPVECCIACVCKKEKIEYSDPRKSSLECVSFQPMCLCRQTHTAHMCV